MTWPEDGQKLDRVRAALRADDLDALVVRAPDNVLYLTNYQSMKGYDLAVFPQEGDPTLIVIEPQLEEATRTAWTPDVRPFRGYDESDPRPPPARALGVALAVARERGRDGRIGVELSQGTQGADLMVGEPTTPTAGFFAAFPGAVDASPLLAGARMIKTPQEIERMRIANEVAARAMEHVRHELRPGMREVEAAALWEAHVHGLGGLVDERVENVRGYSLVWSGPGIRTFTATGTRPVQADQPTLFEIWVSADGYWCD
ncbi:MAG: M24 family metallopeptidase, partial [Gaiellales bacterium]